MLTQTVPLFNQAFNDYKDFIYSNNLILIFIGATLLTDFAFVLLTRKSCKLNLGIFLMATFTVTLSILYWEMRSYI